MKTRDVIIIGSGAGGGPLALSLSAAGADVLVLEKGPFYGREDFTTDEVETLWRGMFVPPIDEEPHILVHEGLAAPRPSTLGWIASCVGGGTVHMGAFLSRFHPDDFRMKSRFGDYESIADWPYTYEDLEPYYTRAEWEVGVSGASESNPHEGKRSRGYPMPPLDANPLASHLENACRRLGLHPYPTPRGINSRPYQGRPACSYCSACASYGCRSGARGSVPEALLSRAVATGRCELLQPVMVREVTLDSLGRANGCVFLDAEGKEHEVRARVVCICCSAVESARLLLLSKSPRFPLGLCNDNGLVGRNLQFHGTSFGDGVFRHDGMPFDHANPFLGRSLMDHYFLPDGVSDLPKGGLLVFQYKGGSPIRAAKIVAQQGPRTVWGDELKRRLRENSEDRGRSLSFEVHHDFIPNEGTFVSLDPEVRDKWGLPVARIHLHELEHHRKAGRWLVERGLDVFTEMGADAVEPSTIGETAPYLVHGTCRAGRDPETSVVDGYCQAHQVANLFVVDGSFMPTSGGAPPTLTILANSFRTADHIIARAKTGDFG
ncbi:MAG TPA: GMC family oxidoreductase [Thermoanaerobaculia bacterium]|nr:GMC family oxidoreductase [Thermoanaerobaculia bacterium]